MSLNVRDIVTPAGIMETAQHAEPGLAHEAITDAIFGAIRQATAATNGESIVIAADGTVGRLKETRKTWCSYHGGDRILCHNPLDCDVSPLYRVVTP